VRPGTRTEVFRDAVKVPVHIPLSGRTMSFNGGGACVSGCWTRAFSILTYPPAPPARSPTRYHEWLAGQAERAGSTIGLIPWW